MTVARYTIVTVDYLPNLESAVNRLIQQGWQPYGAPVFYQGGFSQAMVIDHTDDDPPGDSQS